MAFRADITPLGQLEATPQGGIKTPAAITRTGVFEYATEDGGVIREFRPPEEVFHKDAIKAFDNAPVTNEHPPEHVHPANFSKYAKGHVEPGVRQEGDKLTGSLVIQDAGLINDIKGGKREVSSGYHCDIDETPGVTPDGQRYDRIQRNIRGNHVAIVTTGRAGPDVRLRLDSAGNQVIENTSRGAQDMKIEIIDGREYEVGSQGHRDAVTRRDQEAVTVKARLDEADRLKAEHAKEKARADKAEADRQKAEKARADATSPQALDRRVQLREAIVKTAKTVLGEEFKADGLSNDEIKRKAVSKAHPHLKVEKMDAKELKGAFLTLVPKKGERREDAIDRMRVPGTPIPTGGRMDGARGGRTVSQIRMDAQTENDLRSSRPLALSKDSPFKQQSNHPMLQSGMMENQR